MRVQSPVLGLLLLVKEPLKLLAALSLYQAWSSTSVKPTARQPVPLGAGSPASLASFPPGLLTAAGVSLSLPCNLLRMKYFLSAGLGEVTPMPRSHCLSPFPSGLQKSCSERVLAGFPYPSAIPQ